MGALIIRIGFRAPVYYTCNKEHHRNSIGKYLGHLGFSIAAVLEGGRISGFRRC